MSQMDLFLPLLATGDIRKRLTLGNDIINYLEEANNDIECEDIGGFVAGVLPWTTQSNFRVSQNGLEILALLVDRLKEDFRPYLSSVVPLAIDRLGDARDTVREKAHILLIKLMLSTVSPRHMWERLTPSLAHKRFKVREELLVLLQNALADHGSAAIHLTPLIPSVVRLLSDSSAPVREAAFNTLVEVYRHVGERFRQDLLKKYELPHERVPALMSAFDAARDAGELKSSASPGPAAEGPLRDGQDEVDHQAVGQTLASRSTSAPPVRPAVSRKASAVAATNGTAAAAGARRSVRTRSRSPSVTRRPADMRLRRTHSLASRQSSVTSSLSGTVAGAIDEAMFIASFEQVPKLQLFSARDLEDTMLRIREVIGKPSNAWDDRVEALKKLRGVLVAGGTNFDELYQHLRLMEPALQLTLQDLRSQVVREGCITVAYLAQQLTHRADHVCLALLPYLIDLIPNSAKVISTSGVVAIRFIIQHAPSARLIPVITGQMTAKSREIRRACAEFLEQLVTSWPTATQERHVAGVQEALRKGVSDADSEVRATCRRTYWGFAAHFPQQADSLLNSLDAQHQRSLAGERTRPADTGAAQPKPTVRSHSVLGATSRGSSRAGSRESLHRTGSLSRRAGAALAAQARAERGESPAPESTAAPRSTSAIDLQAAQRARARAQYAAAQRQRAAAGGAGASLPRVRRLSSTGGPLSPRAVPPGGADSVRSPRARHRPVSQSQPGSRSVSPSSRLSYATFSPAPVDAALRASGRRSGIPRSTGPSRETSPHRRTAAAGPRVRTPSGGGGGGAASRILQQSREAETALADALASSRQRTGRYADGGSDESETSSVCSERSFDSRRDRSGLPKPQRIPVGSRLGSIREPASGTRDVSETLARVASTQWSDRKEGLLQLRAVLRSSRSLTATELRRVTDTLGRLFMDQHTKVFGVFLDTLQELVLAHAADLADWLYVLLTRLLHKLGADLLGSVVQKIDQTLETIRTSFRCEDQLHCLCRLLTDPTQTPSARVKVATLRHLRALLETMEPAALVADDSLAAAVAKILQWSTDQRSVETRNGAKAVVVSMFYLNTAQFTKLQSQLTRHQQDAASDIIQAHLRRRTGVEQTQQTLSSPRSPVSPRSPLNGAVTPVRSTRPGSAEPDQTDRPVRRAVAELQSLRLDGVSTSQDSGLGRCSAERRLGSPGGAESPVGDEAALVVAALSELRVPRPADPPPPETRTALMGVCKLAKYGSDQVWAEHIGALLPPLLDCLRDGGAAVRELALTALSELARRPAAAALLLPSIEEVLARVLEAHRERAPTEREAVRAAEQCAAVLAGRLPLEAVLPLLLSRAESAPFPENQAAVKALTRLVEAHGSAEVTPHLSEIMPSLLRAYDNTESSVRKAAVFCMVTLHAQCGEELLQPHLISLPAAKLKLLNVYIKRTPSTAARAGPASPK